MERKSSKEYSVVFLVEGKKSLKLVQVKKFAFEKFIFAVGSAANSVGTTQFISQHLATVSTPDIAELVPSGFFRPQL